MIPRAQFLEAVRSCIGTQVGHRGRTIGGALDCVGVPWAACKACGLELPESGAYGILPTGDQLTSGLLAYCERVWSPDRAHIYQVYAGRQARHVVIPVGYDETGQELVVHAWGKNRIVQQAVLADPVAAYWRIRGIE